jgi:hypothetical protein
MAGTPSRKPRFTDRIKRFFLTGKTLKGILWAAFLLTALFIINQTVLPRIGYKLRIGSDGVKFGDFVYYSKNESKILNILVEDSPIRDKIPQKKYILSRTGLKDVDFYNCIESLAEKGDIVIGEAKEIIRAYPWADTSEFRIFLIVSQDSIIGPLRAASAFHAMSVPSLMGHNTRIEATLKDTGEPLVIEIGNNQIVYVSRITAVAYRTEDHENSAFYSSPDAIEAEYSGQYDVNKVIRIDRALVIGNVIAREIKDKISR